MEDVSDFQLLAIAAENALNLLTELFPELRPDEDPRDLDIALACEQLREALAGTGYGQPEQPRLLDTSQVAAILGISRRRVEALIVDGRLSAEKVGRDWLIRPEDLDRVKVRRPGRPSGGA